jgi:hypothetical protein
MGGEQFRRRNQASLAVLEHGTDRCEPSAARSGTDLPATADEVEPADGTGSSDVEQASALALPVVAVEATSTHPAVAAVVLDEVEDHHGELAALETVSGAYFGSELLCCSFGVAKCFEGGLNLDSVGCDDANRFAFGEVVLGQYASEQAAGRPPSFGGTQAAHDSEVVQTVGVDDDDFGVLRVARPRVTHAKRARRRKDRRRRRGVAGPGRALWRSTVLDR